MQKVKLNILGLSVSQTQSGAYALVLTEEDGFRRIPIIIGPVEAQAIAIQLEELKPPRPLTHDLFKNMASAFEIALEEVVIYKLEEGIFYSELVCTNGKKQIRIDSRTSDAIALSLRFRCPIYTSEEILKKAGIIMEDHGFSPKQEEKGNEYQNYSLTELKRMQDEAISNEDYEKASQIRDEISRRKKA